MKISLFVALVTTSIALTAHAQRAAVGISDVDANDSTAILIRKGEKNLSLTPPDYDIVSDREDVVGEPENDRKKAYDNWKTACADWKRTLREMNKDNSILAMNCNQPAMQKDDYYLTFKSVGTYKMKVRIRDRK